jgi:hypothetical protein
MARQEVNQVGRIYAVAFSATVTNAGGDTDLWEFLPADDKPIKLRGFRLGQTSELADAAEESVRITITRLAATVTSSDGTSRTPIPMDSADVAAGFSAEYNGDTVATTSGATTIIEEMAWNLRMSPFEVWYPDDRFAPKAKQGEGLFIRLQSTLTDDIDFAGTAWVEEE